MVAVWTEVFDVVTILWLLPTNENAITTTLSVWIKLIGVCRFENCILFFNLPGERGRHDLLRSTVRSQARRGLPSHLRPQFRYIARGLLLPPADSAGFMAAQAFCVLPCSEYNVPPVCLFPL